MRNPFRRQTETPAPSLRERAADLSSRLANGIRKPEATEDATFPAAPADACHCVVQHQAWIDQTADSDLTGAILDGWREWGSMQGITDDAVQSEVDARRRALIHAAMALPATTENIASKALACAWMEWVETERPGQPRDAYGPADRLVYDIHAAAMARGAPENSQPGTMQPRGIDLVSRIDFSAATMNELLHIRSIADHIGSMAYTHHQGARCEGGRNAFGFRLENDLGKLMISLGDALTEVESAADAEAKRRTPDDAGDRQTRLFMLTPPAIDNDDPDEIEALALQMLAHAAAERAKG